MKFEPIINICDKLNLEYKINAKTALINSFRVGNEAALIIYPDCLNSFCALLDLIIDFNFKYTIIGNGTNVYFCDYYDGIIIITKKLNAIEVFNNKLIAMCGADITKCSVLAYENSLSGLEFAYGIPGTIGGATYINASAFDSSISNVTYESLVYDKKSKDVKILNFEQHKFDIKASVFSKENSYVILKTTFKLSCSKKGRIKEKMDAYINKRIQTQPLNLPSAGSVFVKPKSTFASKLIDEAGLKGYRIGGIEVSKKHAGFFVNTGNGTAKDVNDLIAYVKNIVKEKYNVQLNEEIIFIE